MKLLLIFSTLVLLAGTACRKEAAENTANSPYKFEIRKTAGYGHLPV